MTSFIVRVELHNAASGDYTKLHKIMQNAGFGNAIKGDDGNLYHLPTAEYHTIEPDHITAIIVRDVVQKLIIPLGLKYWILVSKAESLAWISEVVKP